MRVYNSPDPKRIQNSDTFRITEANSKNIAPGYGYIKQSYMGNDLLQLSDDYSTQPNQNYNQSYYSYDNYNYSYGYNYNYRNFLKLFMIMIGIILLITVSISTLVILGGLISIIIFALVVLVSVFLYSINLNPFEKATYKKVAGLLR